jgi:cytochrome c6
MRRTVLALVVLVAALGAAAAGCGGGEEASPTPDTVTGTTDTTETETTETETTETETTETETTGTETTATDTTGTGGQGDAAAGKQVFITNCGTCHTLADAGTTGTVGPNLDDAKPSFDLAVDRVTNGQGVMPPFKDTLSQQQITDVATYVSQAAGG